MDGVSELRGAWRRIVGVFSDPVPDRVLKICRRDP
jgi:hypothetical protein